MKISVIIPVFNAEKYLPVCLESLTIQTFTDFEVIVVDDCSTDNSVAVAESYLERFGERLKIVTLPENTGSGSIPRNVGLEHARGEYVFFVDNDDLLIDNALENLYNAAKDYRADVVSMELGFYCDEEPVPKNFTLEKWIPAQYELPDKPVLESDDFEARVNRFYNDQFEWVPWSKLLRREFLIDNDITFPAMKISDDIIWALKLIFSAKRWLRLPTPLYVQRETVDSFSRRERTPEQIVKFYASPLIIGVDCLNKFMRRNSFLKQNPPMQLQLINFFANFQFDAMADAINALDAPEIYEIFLREFSNAGSPQSALIAYLLVMNNLYRNELTK